MRILFVTPQPPSPTGGGAAIRNWHLIQAAADAGHEIFTINPESPFVLHAFQEVPLLDPLVPRDRFTRIRDLFTQRLPDLAVRLREPMVTILIGLDLDRFDVIQVEGLEMWENLPKPRPDWYRLATRHNSPGRSFQMRLPEKARRLLHTTPEFPPLIYDAHNAETTLQGRTALNSLKRREIVGAGYSAVQWAKLRAYEREIVRTATATLALSAEDARALETLSGRAVDIVPVGVDTAYFAPDAPGLPALIPFDVVFSGTLDYRPNADAARWLVREVWPLVRTIHPGATLAVVGRNPLPELRAHDGQHGVTITGAVSDDRPYMAGAAIYALPIRFGAGVRLKLLNAMSMGCAVITTPAGAEGVAVQNGRDLLLAPPTAMGFAAGIAAMLTYPDHRVRYGDAARRLMVARHDWSCVTPALLRVYERIERGRV